MSNFWKDKRVFLTGHTGFKGSWLNAWLSRLGAKVYGYSLEPDQIPNLFDAMELSKQSHGEFGDIRNFSQLGEAIKKFRPEIIFHLAAQPLVRKSYVDPISTYSTNIMGTVNLLEAVRNVASVRAVVNITTDKCYENNEWCWGYRENEPMGGHDPYSASKGCSELITSSYINSFFQHTNIGLASARAGNVIGGGDWSADRLVPDMLQALSLGDHPKIRNPYSIRPWQHVLEPLSGYIKLAMELYNEPVKYSGAWNFGPLDHDCRRVEWVADELCNCWDSGVTWVSQADDGPHEARYLKLDISKASTLLGWKPRWGVERAIKNTVIWHKEYTNGNDAFELILNQIKEYENA